MGNCNTCKYAECDYETYYGTSQKEWFVCGCKKDNDFPIDDDDECEDYEEGVFEND